MVNININEFAEKFQEEYNFLYNNSDNVAGYREAVEAFDAFLKDHSDFVGEFAKYRQDFISSDREAAAFMFALNSFPDYESMTREQLEELAIDKLVGSMEYNGTPYEELKENAGHLSREELIEYIEE